MKKIKTFFRRLFMTKREKWEEKLLAEYEKGNFLKVGENKIENK